MVGWWAWLFIQSLFKIKFYYFTIFPEEIFTTCFYYSHTFFVLFFLSIELKLFRVFLFFFRYRTSWWARMNHWRPVKPFCDGLSAPRPSTRVSASRISPPPGRTAWLSTPSSIATGAVVFFVVISLFPFDFSIFVFFVLPRRRCFLCRFPCAESQEKEKNKNKEKKYSSLTDQTSRHRIHHHLLLLVRF